MRDADIQRSLQVNRRVRPPDAVAATALSRPRVLVRWRRLALGVAVVLAVLVVWQALVNSRTVPVYVLPPPVKVGIKWLELLRNGALWHHVSTTLEEASLGFAVAFVIGTGLGYPLAKSRLLASVVAPYIAAVQSMPMIALAPLIVVWFGLGVLPKIIIAVLIVFFPMLINTMVGLLTIDRDLIEAAISMGASPLQLLRFVEVPLALRTILGGVKLGISLAMTGALVSEFVVADAGLGYMMTLARSLYDSPMLYAASLTMAGMTFLGYAAVNLLEQLLIDW